MSADPAVFLGRVDADGTIHLDEPQRQRAYCRAKLAGKCVDVIICEQGERKTELQRKGFHAMLAPWLKEGLRLDALKRDLLIEIFGTHDHTNPITGEVTREPNESSTEGLSRAKYSELIERTLDIAAECGVILEAPSEYRERKAREARKALKIAS